MKRSIRSSSPLCEQKCSLRREKERQTASLLPEYIKESDSAIIEKLLNLSEFKNAETVFLYYSVGREVSTTALIDKLMDEGRSTALPVSGNNGAMSFYPVIGKAALRPGKFGIPEPPGDTGGKAGSNRHYHCSGTVLRQIRKPPRPRSGVL